MRRRNDPHRSKSLRRTTACRVNLGAIFAFYSAWPAKNFNAVICRISENRRRKNSRERLIHCAVIIRINVPRLNAPRHRRYPLKKPIVDGVRVERFIRPVKVISTAAFLHTLATPLAGLTEKIDGISLLASRRTAIIGKSIFIIALFSCVNFPLPQTARSRPPPAVMVNCAILLIFLRRECSPLCRPDLQ